MLKAQSIGDLTDGELGSREFLFGFIDQLLMGCAVVYLDQFVLLADCLSNWEKR